jgi:hypothetical protein
MSVDASRVTYIPHLGRHLSTSFLAALAVPAIVGGAPAFLVTGLVWALGSFSAAWHTGLVLVGLGLVAGLVLGGWFLYQQLAEVRWFDVQPTGVVFKRVRGAETIAAAELRSVHVVEKIKLGRSTGCEIRFTTADRQFTCPRTFSNPLLVPAATLDGFLTERLGPAGVEVTHETVVERAGLLVEHWYTRSQVAALWGVRVEEVDDLARRHEVPNRSFTPRVGAMHGVNRTVQVFNPDDVHIVASTTPSVPRPRR